MNSINLITIFLVITVSLVQSDPKNIKWKDGNWAEACDFYGNDLQHVQVPGEQCGEKCVTTSGCTHFTWTKEGICWMKKGFIRKSNAIYTADYSMVCGIVQSKKHDSSYFPVYNNVKTTHHGANEVGACRLPEESYAVHNPVALGNLDSLRDLKFQGNLCGHILEVDCGNGKIEIIVSNSNLGGGLDLYRSSWNKATNNLPPGEKYCSIRMTNLNPLTSNAYKCYHATGETNNQYYRSVGLLNTAGRVVKAAKFNEINGVNNGQDLYYSFNVFGTSNDKVTFYFQDGGSHSIPLSSCFDGSRKKYWN